MTARFEGVRPVTVLADYPGKRYLDWQLDDPAGQNVDAVRPIIEEIDGRVQGLLAELLATSASS
jgi:arsenate reductase (thioredoxin)